MVVLNFPGNLPAALQSNYSEFPNSCPSRQFALGVNAFQMLVHGRNRDLEQLRDERLCQPERLILKPALDARAAVLRLVEDDF